MLLDATFIKRLSWVHSDGNTWFDPGIVLGSYGAQCEELRLEARAHIYICIHVWHRHIYMCVCVCVCVCVCLCVSVRARPMMKRQCGRCPSGYRNSFTGR